MLAYGRAACPIRNVPAVFLQVRSVGTRLTSSRFQPLASSSKEVDVRRWAVQGSDSNISPKSWSQNSSDHKKKYARSAEFNKSTKSSSTPAIPTKSRPQRSSTHVVVVEDAGSKTKHFNPTSTVYSKSNALKPTPTSHLESPGRQPTKESRPLWEAKEIASEYDADLSEKDHRRHEIKSRFKTRSSLKEGGTIERQSRVPNVRKEKPNKQKQKDKSPKLISYMQDVFIPPLISVGHLSRLLNVSLESLQRIMIDSGMKDAISYDHVLDSDHASILALEFEKNPIIDEEAAFDIFPPKPHPDPSSLPLRPPIVTVMGHVDHGKTTLLDTLRSASVARGEAGGITQHIGAFSVPVTTDAERFPNSITFLDTPGHAAFSAMRARGARVTDIVVLVVAADDGVMPQTKEVIELVKKDDKLGVVVAINKIDKPGVNPDDIKKSLLAEGLLLECFDGHIPVVEVSGLTGEGLNQLLETISLMADVAELRAERHGSAYGYILESKVLKGLGPVATVLVLRGELSSGINLISGIAQARIRQLTDSNGKVVKTAHPGMAVTVAGWKELPAAGDEVLQGSEVEIKKAITNRMRRLEEAVLEQDAEAINEQRKAARIKRETLVNAPEGVTHETTKEVTNMVKELRLVIKCDVSGSAEAVVGALEGIGNNLARVKIIQSSVGDVTESDIMMAKAVSGAIVAFSVSVPRAIRALAAADGIPIISSDVIYRLMEDVKENVVALLPPIIETRVIAEATVAQLFDIHLKRKVTMKVAGCKVTNGLLEKNKPVRVVRNGKVIHSNDTLQTLRHFKKDVQEIRKDMECGLSLTTFKELQAGDIIQSIQITSKPGVF